jgi:hypothetical protein
MISVAAPREFLSRSSILWSILPFRVTGDVCAPGKKQKAEPLWFGSPAVSWIDGAYSGGSPAVS